MDLSQSTLLPNPSIDFVIVTALPEEMDAVLDKLSGYKQLSPTQDSIRTYFQADIPVNFPDNFIGKYHVIGMCLPGIGRLQAATATIDAIRMWNPRNVILIGIAGGVAARKINIGDILIPEQIVDYELQKLTRERSEERYHVYPVDVRLLDACNNFRNKDWVEQIKINRPDQGKPKRHTGPIASGDKVIAYGDVIARIQADWPKLIGVEMEAAGVAIAALQSAEKPGFFMVRCVSDLADENKDSGDVQEWRSYACDAAATFAIEFLKSGPIPLTVGGAQTVQIQSAKIRKLIDLPNKPVGIPDYRLKQLGLSKQSQENLANLLDRIIKKECCAFIGAGLSIPAGYPSWSELLDKLKIESENYLGEEINDEHLDYYERAEEYRNILGKDNYLKVIHRKFDPDNNKQPWLAVHLYLVKMPFISFVTTNYDCLIEKACIHMGFDPVYSHFPLLPVSRVRDGHQIYHIHGIIDHSRLLETWDSIILTKTDFERAYSPESNLVNLITCLYKELTILFVGFNVRDPFMMRILKNSLSDFEKTQQIAFERGIGRLKNIKHYALLPYPIKPIADPFEKRKYPENIDEEATNLEDEDLESMGVYTIRYIDDSYNHTNLISIIHELHLAVNEAEEHPISQDWTFRGV